MAIIAPAPDQVFSGLMRSMTVPVSYPQGMSPADSLGYSSSLEKNMVEPSACGTALYFSRPYPVDWQTLQEMQVSSTAPAILAGPTLGCGVPAEMLGSSLINNDWHQQQPLVDTSAGRFSSSLPQGVSGNRGIMEDARIRAVMGRCLAAKNLGGQAVGGVSSSWNAMDVAGITLDPSKGGLALQTGVGLAASHTLGQFTSDSAFAERAANNFSSFSASGKYSQIVQRTGSPAAGAGAGNGDMFEIVQGTSDQDKCSAPAIAASVQQVLEAVEGATEATMDHAHEVEVSAQENSSCTEQQGGRGECSSGGASPATSPSHDSASRKRKKSPIDKDPDSKVVEVENSKPKRCKGEARGVDREDTKSKGERSSSETSVESGSPKAAAKESQRPKEHSKQDYIHVRARRGQATDSHSLAERVRREKISERMKYLQDLVPGCRKVTGKAVMLDEIINYVQSLQRQVEHLSMKLASVNPGHSDLTLESLLNNKEILQSQLSNILGSSETSPGFRLLQPQHQGPLLGGPCGFDFRSMGTGLDVNSRRTMSPPIPSPSDITMVRSFDNNVSRSTGWDGELQSVVHMGLNQQGRFGSFEGLHCQLPVGHMKVEF